MASSSPSSSSQSLLHGWNPSSPTLPTSHRLCFSNGLSSQRKPSAKRGLVIASARKKKDKTDNHSFVPRPDEATGPFPEAVLLKEKKVTEDGRVLPEFADAEEEKLFEFLSLQLESDLNIDRMRHYEVVYLIREDCIDEVESITSKAQEFVREKKGRIWRLNNWGLRRLAYKIRKATQANYILMNFELDAKYINDFKSMLDKDERIIRHLVMKRDEAITEDCPPPPEFHTLRAESMEQEEEEESDIDVDDEGDDWDDNDELEMAGDDTEDGSGYNIIIVDEDEDDRESGARRRSKAVNAEKIAR